MILLLISSMLIPIEINLALQEASIATDIPLEVLYAVAKQESNFNPNAVSKNGAIGLMQIKSAVAQKYNVKNLYDPKENALAGAKSLSTLLKLHKGNWAKTLASYNWGIGNVNKNPHYTKWPETTQNYVFSIMKRSKRYFALWI